MAFKAKRKFPRSTRREGVKVRTAVGLEYGTFDDLSIGGIKLFLDHSKQEDELMQVEFNLPGSPKIEIRATGRVVRSVKSSTGYEIGVEFLHIHPALRGELQEFCDKIDTVDGPF